MIRLSEEQRAILSCYSGTKEEVIAELRKAISFIEDVELCEEAEALLTILGRVTNTAFEDEFAMDMSGSFDET